MGSCSDSKGIVPRSPAGNSESLSSTDSNGDHIENGILQKKKNLSQKLLDISILQFASK